MNKDIEQALRSLSYIEKQDRIISAREISDQLKIPFEKLSKILQKLTAGGIIKAQRGRQGGYSLTKPLSETSLDQLYKILDESYKLVPCMEAGQCFSMKICTILPGMSLFQKELDSLMRKYVLSDFSNYRAKEELAHG